MRAKRKDRTSCGRVCKLEFITLIQILSLTSFHSICQHPAVSSERGAQKSRLAVVHDTNALSCSAVVSPRAFLISVQFTSKNIHGMYTKVPLFTLICISLEFSLLFTAQTGDQLYTVPKQHFIWLEKFTLAVLLKTTKYFADEKRQLFSV